MTTSGLPMAWVTLATTDAYSLGALVLAHSLRETNTAHQLVILVTPGVSEQMRSQLSNVFDHVINVDVMDSGDAAHLALMARPELGVTLTKLHCWTLTQFSKCVFLDADCLVIENCDELFEREELSAAPDIGWPDCFNSGVFVFRPSQETFTALVNLATEVGSFDGGDQGLLNTFFSDWATKDISKHLPFLYNMTVSAAYTYLPAFRRFGRDVKIVHFLGAKKPWHTSDWGEGGPAGLFFQAWWSVYRARVRPAAPQFMPQDEWEHHRIQDALSQVQRAAPPRARPEAEMSVSGTREGPAEVPFHPPSHLSHIVDLRQSANQSQRAPAPAPPNPVPSSVPVNPPMASIGPSVAPLSVAVNPSVSPPSIPISVSVAPLGVIVSPSAPSSSASSYVHVSSDSSYVQVPTPSVGSPGPEGAAAERSRSAPPPVDSELEGRRRWEQGRADYTGLDRFDRVWERIVRTLERSPDQPEEEGDSELVSSMGQVQLGPEQAEADDKARRAAWERGQMDYMGSDSFENILAKINQTLGENK